MLGTKNVYAPVVGSEVSSAIFRSSDVLKRWTATEGRTAPIEFLVTPEIDRIRRKMTFPLATASDLKTILVANYAPRTVLMVVP